MPIRRIEEHFGGLLPIMTALFLPIALFAKTIYPWMTARPEHRPRASIQAAAFYGADVLYRGGFVFRRLGSFVESPALLVAETRRDRRCRMHAQAEVLCGLGIFAFAVTLTLGAIMWMKALQHQWFSTMYGVYYFAGSVWTTLPTIFLIALVLKRSEPFRTLLTPTLFYYLDALMFAFTVFYAYIHFLAVFHYLERQRAGRNLLVRPARKGSWWDIGMVIVFGHFLVPFLALLRIDFKLKLSVMIPLCIWAWLMHFAICRLTSCRPRIRTVSCFIGWTWRAWHLSAGCSRRSFWRCLRNTQLIR